MTDIHAVIGQAGTGKTTWLMEKAVEMAPIHLTAAHHSMLAITRMHGARRRLQAKLRESCPTVRCQVTTIDAFALAILNRWRTALGYSRPIQPVRGDSTFTETVFGIEAGFTHIAAASTCLLQSMTISALIRETYPLVMIDEFQDCHGPVLDFVKAISACSTLFLAADDFQFLDSTANGCPAVDWLNSMVAIGKARIERLSFNHRTAEGSILEAARCLREGEKSEGKTILTYCCPSEHLAGWKIADALILGFYTGRWSGDCAVICPSHDPFINKALGSCNAQLVKKQRSPITWHEERAREKEVDRIASSLSVEDLKVKYEDGDGHSPRIGHQIAMSIERFARLRGLREIPKNVISAFVERAVQNRRAHSPTSSRRVVTTIHGAKNREFENVIVIWSYKVLPNPEAKRRLLYNAITRARKRCMLIVPFDEKKTLADSVLSLLGPPEAGQRNTKKAKTGRRRSETP
jgi:superfamily I DNA/RNA helicase